MFYSNYNGREDRPCEPRLSPKSEEEKQEEKEECN